jgi:hypothetical protein
MHAAIVSILASRPRFGSADWSGFSTPVPTTLTSSRSGLTRLTRTRVFSPSARSLPKDLTLSQITRDNSNSPTTILCTGDSSDNILESRSIQLIPTCRQLRDNFLILPRRCYSAIPSMASAAITSNPQPLATTSNSRQNHLSSRSFSGAGGVYEDQESQPPRSNMSFSMSQGSQGSGLMPQPSGPFRQYDGGNSALSRRDNAPQIYSVSIPQNLLEQVN